MIKVFLAEDESLIREGLRDSIPWEQYGYSFVGEAGDGEQALPMIRRLKPDILITDIRMPFMDGLELGRLVSKEFPGMKIIIISGYDDFEYARAAIGIGVEQYLLKPITKAMLIRTLQEVRQKLESEREQEDYLNQFRREIQEYEQYSRKQFLEEVITGQFTVGETYERAEKLNIRIQGPWYNLLLLNMQSIGDDRSGGMKHELFLQFGEELNSLFLDLPQYFTVRQNLTTYAILIHGEQELVELSTKECAEKICRTAQEYEKDMEWYLAIGEPVERISSLSQCYQEVSRCLSYRHLLPGRHILDKESVSSYDGREEENRLKNLDMSKIDPAVIQSFLRDGQPEEVEDFVTRYVRGLHEAAKSKLFCQYILLNVRFTTVAFLENLGCKQETYLDAMEGIQWLDGSVTIEKLESCIRQMLEKALELREGLSRNQNRDMISQALAYIDENYHSETISLTEVAKRINVSANYFSAVFSQEMQQTFVEYLTAKRMEKAREMLRNTDKRTAEIASEVGYKDSHYFSFVFRKTQGCTPRDYRTGGKKG